MAGSGAASLGGTAWVHGSVTRFVGDTTYRAWRFKVGPAFDQQRDRGAPDPGSGQASVGATWTAVPHIELSADVGVAQAGTGAAGAFPSTKKAKKNAGPSTTSPSLPASGTAEVAVRFTFPWRAGAR